MKKLAFILLFISLIFLCSCKTTTYKISFYDENRNLIQTIEVEEGTKVANYPAVPQKEGYDGFWALDGSTTQYTLDDVVINEDIALYPHYDAIIINYTYAIDIYLEQIDGTYVKDEAHSKSLTTTTFPVTFSLDDIEGFTTPSLESYEITKEGTVEARYKRNSYTFKVNYLDQVKAYTFKYQEAIVLEEIEVTNYTFIRYQEDFPTVMPANDITVNALFNPDSFSISYEVNEGTINGNIVEEYLYGIGLENLPTASKVGYSFVGWSPTNSSRDIITSISKTANENMTLYAMFKEMEPVEVTFNLQGGSTRYQTRDALVADFISDFNRVTGRSATPTTLYSVGNYYGEFFANQAMFTKWSWLIQYIYDLGEKGIGRHTESQAQYQTFLAGNGTSVTSQWAVRQNFQGFMTKTKCGSYSGAAAVDFSIYEYANEFWEYIESEVKIKCKNVDEMVAYKEFYAIEGWYDNPQCTGDAITIPTENMTLYAKWIDATPITEIEVVNEISELEVKTEYQLQINLHPSSVPKETKLVYKSSDANILSITDEGHLKAHNVGVVTITITNKLETISKQMTINVYCNLHIDLDFSEDFNGTLDINEEATVKPTVLGNTTSPSVKYDSSNKDVATIGEDGKITALSYGRTVITATLINDETICMTFEVLVMNKQTQEGIDSLLKALIAGNEAVVYTDNVCLYNSTQKLYKPTYGSVNLYLFDGLNIDRTTYLMDPLVQTNKTSGIKTSTEFITIHDTANYSGGLKAHGSYWMQTTHTTSIHFTVGDYGVIQDLPTNYSAHHAGDKTNYTFAWNDTSVKANGNTNPNIDINSAGYFTFNGQATTIAAPRNNQNQILDKSYFTTLGPMWKIGDNGNYYLATTWFDTSQVLRGVIANKGGNLNSTGIEMCVNQTGDIYDTWQRTAKLVGELLIEHQLGVDRVVQHNTFTGKNCPQTLRTANYWNHFIKMIELEYFVQKNFPGAEVTMVSDNPQLVDNTGRVISCPIETKVVTYTLTVKWNGQERSEKLSSVIPGLASWQQKDGFYTS